ncbi:MAG: YrzI family small protein [Bacillota bacterium]|nr:YrzI family small protein [Bacillota bacterium]MDP4170174.1 YrzI family small protein [Bacillota bacterium]
MTLNIFFLTITFKRRVMDVEEILHQERIKQLLDEHKDRQFYYYRPM